MTPNLATTMGLCWALHFAQEKIRGTCSGPQAVGSTRFHSVRTIRFVGIGTPLMGTILRFCLSSSQKNRDSLAWVLVALTVCFTYPVLYRVSSESRAGEWEF